ncbi:MAG: hypothetical protein ABGZ53_11810, partial [Fuerstiella sp.]
DHHYFTGEGDSVNEYGCESGVVKSSLSELLDLFARRFDEVTTHRTYKRRCADLSGAGAGQR